MQFISLRIHQNRVVASGGLAAGNAVASVNESIEWRNGHSPNERRVFLVKFFKFSGLNQVPIWPFPEGAVGPDQQVVDTQNVRWLRVANDKPAPPIRKNLDGELIKYEAHLAVGSETNPGLLDTAVEFLDPMIIIRSKNVSVMLGVTCAVLGALAGALLVTWWT